MVTNRGHRFNKGHKHESIRAFFQPFMQDWPKGRENDVRKKEYNISCKVFTPLRGDIDMNSPESGTPYKLFKPKIIISNEIFSYLHKSILSHKNRRKLNKC